MRVAIYIVGGLVVILAIVLVVLHFTGSGDDANINNSNENTNINALENSLANENVNLNENTNGGTKVNVNLVNNTATNPVKSSESSLKAIARSFAERFGTYSNHSDYENIEHLLPYMTSQMKQWATNFVEGQRASAGYAGIYFGTTTKALSVETLLFSEETGTAEFLVQTQRKESTGATSNARIYYQDIKIKFEKEEQSVWKVDQSWWQ